MGEAWRLDDMLPLGRVRGSPPVTRIAYLDTETTGLAGGSGTVVFAAALCRPLSTGMEVVQLFLPEPAGEAAFLWVLQDELERSTSLATYNGASFDLPLLRTRWIMARMPGELRHPDHVDLLHLTRALLKQRLESCALRVVEDRLLGFEREDDLPGRLVAEAYLAYLRRGWSPWLEAALAHNRQDVLSLWHLHARLRQRLDLADPSVDTAADWLALGRQLTRQGRRADGWRALRCAAELAEGPASVQAGLLLARRLVRLNRAEAAAALLAGLPQRPDLVIARARILEWRLRRFDEALALVEDQLTRSGAGGAEHLQLEARRSRLRRRASGPSTKRSRFPPPPAPPAHLQLEC
jgi:hypothetical protein